MSVAIDGEQADPRIAAPAELRPVLGFSRLSAAAYGVIARVIDDDGIFRARVAEAATEELVGRSGWLWLARPVDWLEQLDASADRSPVVASVSNGSTAKRDEKAAVARLRKAASDADAARRRAADQLAEARKAEAAVRSERDQLAATVNRLQVERNAAVRQSKDLEAKLADARRELKVARAAGREAEAELHQLRTSGAMDTTAPASASASATAPPASRADIDRAAAAELPHPSAPAEPPFDRGAVEASVGAAARAAADLAAALADAASALAGPVPTGAPASAAVPEAPAGPAPAKGPKGKKRPKRSKAGARGQPMLPPGVFDGTPEAHRHVITDSATVLIVDGYNVARAAWSGLAPEEERRRTVALLDDVQARSGGHVVVVFDGDDAVTAPKASKSVRVRFSATGETADDAIVDLIAALPPTQPIVVVSSDRAVAADARRQGAMAIGSRAFLVAAGR